MTFGLVFIQKKAVYVSKSPFFTRSTQGTFQAKSFKKATATATKASITKIIELSTASQI